MNDHFELRHTLSFSKACKLLLHACINVRSDRFLNRKAAGDSYGNKDVALKLGARYCSGGWYAPPGVDLAALGKPGVYMG